MEHLSRALPAPTQEEIEIAIDETLSALVAYRHAPRPASVQRALDRRPKGKTFEVITANQIVATDEFVMEQRDYAKGPVDAALKDMLNTLGKMLYNHVGDDGMQEVAERIIALDEANIGRRASPLDSAWNGIGSWHS